MSKQEQKQVIVELKDGDKCEGELVNIDKVNLKIKLANVKKTPASDPSKPEILETLEINKNDIKEIKVIQYEEKVEEKEEQSNINAIPEDKKLNAVQQQQSKQKSYDKNESFFDNLTGLTHPEARQESKNYNDKNKDTFNLPNEPEKKRYQKGNYYNNKGGRGGYQHRGRGRGRGRGGYNNNSMNYYNNNNNGNYYNQNQGRKGRGRGRGGYNQNYRGGQGYNQQQGQFTKQMEGNKLTPYQPEGGIQPGMEKSIYDN